MVAIISKGMRRKTERGAVLFGVELQDAREELFARMVCDGLSLGVAFSRAGFTSKTHNAAAMLFELPRVQERAAAILEARRTTGVVTLPEVTDMLKRVFSNAISEAEYSAAHNAAFSLARLYGHVTDRSTVEVIRRPSRDPDAPSEQALSSWVEALPGPASADQASFLRIADTPNDAQIAAFPRVPATPLDHTLPSTLPDNLAKPREINWLADTDNAHSMTSLYHTHHTDDIKPNDINGLADGMGVVAGRSENGAPARPVTGTPHSGARSGVLGTTPPGGSEKRAPRQEKQVPVPPGGFPSIEDLF